MSDREQEGGAEAGAAYQNEAGQWVCPECGETKALAIQMGAHRKQAHGVEGRKRKPTGRPRGRPRKDGSSSSSSSSSPKAARQQAIARTLRQLADLSDEMRGRSTELPERLADVIRRDADQLATVIGFAAEQLNPVKWFVDNALAVVTPAVGASGVLRWLARYWRRQMQAGELEPEELSAEEYAARPLIGTGLEYDQEGAAGGYPGAG